MENLTAIVPFWNGHDVINNLLDSLPRWLNVIVVDDNSDVPLNVNKPNVEVLRLDSREYFSGAVNAGARSCKTDFLILNQDAVLEGTQWLDLLAKYRESRALIGEGVMKHPAWPKGYVQGTFMYVRRDAWEVVGDLDAEMYPLWGATCDWQLRACRNGFGALPVDNVPGLVHGEGRKFVDGNGTKRRQRFGDSIMEAMRREPDKFQLFTRTPPAVSVIVPCYNYGRYLHDAINSLLGGKTSIGRLDGQSMQSFEVIIIDDASTDDSWDTARSLHDRWKGIRAMRMPYNIGLPSVLNHAIERAYGEYIHVLSADDMRESWCLETLLKACQSNPHSVAFGHVRVVKDGRRAKLLKLPDYDFDKIVSKNTMPAGIMYPRKAWVEVGGYHEEMRFGREDWAFNVALGASGWCGVHVGDSGNLYRREGQNRSLETSNIHQGEVAPTGSQDWRPYFKEQLRRLFPSVYQGERPMGCCGGGRSARPNKAAPLAAKQMDLPGQAGMVVLEYIGEKSGTCTYWGDITRTPYRFGGPRVRGYVDVRDAPGMLEISEGRRTVFREYVRPAKSVAPIQVDEPEVDIVEDKVETVPEDDQSQVLTDIPGVGDSLAERLREAGYNTVSDIAQAGADILTEIKGISAGKAALLIEAANAL